MAKRRHYRKQKFKVKLKKNTVYSIFAFGVILSGVMLGFSFTRTGPTLAVFNDYLSYYFGSLSFLAPLLLILLGFFFLRLKLFLSQPNVIIGAFIFSVSLLGLTKEGAIGFYLNSLVADVVSGFGAFAVYIAGVLVGLIVLFDTSIDELAGALGAILGFLPKLFPGRFLSFFQKKDICLPISALSRTQLVFSDSSDIS